MEYLPDGWKIQEKVLFRRNFIQATNENYEADIGKAVLASIEKFLRTYPFDPPHLPNQHCLPLNPGTFILPLWIRGPRFPPTSNNWVAFQEFHQQLKPCLNKAQALFKEFKASKYRRVMEYHDKIKERVGPENWICQDDYRSCFSSMRLTLNVASDPVRLTNHPWAVVTFFGVFESGDVRLESPERVWHELVEANVGDTFVLDSSWKLGNQISAGDRYQLELFVPMDGDLG